MRALSLLLSLALLSLGCNDGGGAPPGTDGGGGDGATSGSDAGETPDGSVPTPDGETPPPPDGGASGPCTVGARSCSDVDTERECVDGAGGPSWVERACDPYQHCLEDRCVEACLDECPLGATRGDRTCRLWSSESDAFVSPGAGGHDLARRHLAWMRAHHLANGYVANTVFSDARHETPIEHTGTVDDAEWTGMYLLAEAARAIATRSPDAIRAVEETIERIHQLFAITGTPGYMARFWAPLDGDPLLADLYDPGDDSHFQTRFEGGPAFFHAWTSRDMYSGVLAALGPAYEATSSEAHRELLREIAVTLARELIRQREDVPVRVRYELFGSWQETDLSLDMEHVILVPEEMVDGRVFIQVGSDEDGSDYDSSELRGAREFLPDFQPVLGQIPAIGGLVPSIPRPSSAMMMASVMELALHVTEGVPGWGADRAAVRAHYDAHRDEWLAIMRQYAYHNEEECWRQYFGITIAYHPIYSLLWLTDEGPFRETVQREVLAARMRPVVAGHSNAYFDYIGASQGPAGLVSAAELAETEAQLFGFVAPPKAAVAVDNRGRYPASGECAGHATVPVDVGERVPQDFLWQHHPFRLVNEHVDPRHVYPGTDYLVGYWLGRMHELVEDDAPNTCTRWDPPPMD